MYHKYKARTLIIFYPMSLPIYCVRPCNLLSNDFHSTGQIRIQGLDFLYISRHKQRSTPFHQILYSNVSMCLSFDRDSLLVRLYSKLSLAQELRSILAEYSVYTTKELTTCLDIVQLTTVYNKDCGQKLKHILIKPVYQC
jgi:hypothetical protein